MRTINPTTFYNCSKLEGVQLPDSVTSIGTNAFYNCSSMKNFEIPKNVTSIGGYAFYGCKGLEAIAIPSGVTSIGDYTFQSCSSATTVTIPSGVTGIGKYAFASCSALTEIDIPDRVSTIGERAFTSCSKLKQVHLPAGLTSIEYELFSGCSNLAAIDIPATVSQIGGSAFYNCQNLTSVVLPDKVTYIDRYTFYGCRNMAEIIMDNVKSIDISAFYGCTALKTITLPDGMVSVKDYAFQSCSRLSRVNIPATVTSISSNAFTSSSPVLGVIPGSYADKNYSTSLTKEYLCEEGATGFVLAEEEMSLAKGTARKIPFYRNPAGSTEEITFESRDTAVATVDANGKVLGVSGGSAVIDITEGGVTKQFTVTVTNPLKSISLVNSITNDGSDVSLFLNSPSFTLSVVFDPEDASDKDVTWSISGYVVKVPDQNGVVKLNSSSLTGTATLTAKAGNCSASMKVTVSHDFGELIAEQPASCTGEGMLAHYKCACCSKLFDTDKKGTTEAALKIPAAGHEMTAHEGVEITCAAGGSIPYWSCGNCGGFFADAEGKTALKENEWVVPAGHDLVKTAAVDATCTVPGNIEYWTCSRCGLLFGDKDGSKAINDISETVIAARGHDWDEWQVETPATEDAEGLEVRVCKRDASHTDNRVIPKADHVHQFDQEKAEAEYLKTAADCLKAAVYYMSCRCGEKGTETFVYGTALGHDWDEGKVTTAATCTKAGVKTYTCTVCEETKTEPIAATGHTEEEIPAVAPTSSTAGSTAGTKCSVCGEILTAPTEVPATGHVNIVKVPAKAATLKAAGNKAHYKCSDCGTLFTDAKGTKKTTAANVKIAQLININTAKVTVANQTYTGKALTPDPVVKIGTTTLKKGTDYTAESYSNNTNAGQATVTIKGKGKYGGTATGTFTITPASLANAKVTAKAQTYTGSKLTPAPTVKLGTVTLKKGTDYTVTYRSNVNAGKATITVTGKGNYKGTATGTFTINKAANTLTINKSKATYKQSALKNGKKTFNIGAANAKGTLTYTPDAAAKKVGITVTKAGKVTVPKGCKAGTYKITVKAAGNKNYKEGKKTVTIKVTK